jgi:anti-sigma regulatory factor (Ser/Thr protein kinase)
VAVRRAFDPSPLSVGQARLFVAAALADGGISTTVVVESALLAVSELATNALQHAKTAFEVVVDSSEAVRITVVDGSPELPRLRAAHGLVEGGRGVPIIDATAARWGTERAGVGKAVWWEIDLPPVHLTDQGPLTTSGP